MDQIEIIKNFCNKCKNLYSLTYYTNNTNFSILEYCTILNMDINKIPNFLNKNFSNIGFCSHKKTRKNIKPRKGAIREVLIRKISEDYGKTWRRSKRFRSIESEYVYYDEISNYILKENTSMIITNNSYCQKFDGRRWRRL